jgi:hypothetical protein
MVCDSHPRSDLEEAGALFNVGVSLFDLAHDGFPDVASALAELVPKEVILRAAEGDVVATELARDAAQADEVLLLISLISGFFRRLSRLKAKPERRSALTAEIIAAHQVELRSVASAGDVAEAAAIAAASSAAPFRVLARLATLDLDEEVARPAEVAAERIGRVFGLVDDLTDLVVDVQDNSLNGLLLSAQLPSDIADRAAIEALLDGDAVKTAAEEVVAEVRAIQMLPHSSVVGLDVLMQHSIRAWLEGP